MRAERQAGSPRGPGRWIGGLFVVASLTFATAYYVPLYRTHRALLGDYTSLTQSTKSLEEELTRARADLGVATKRADDLAARVQVADARKRESIMRLRRIQTEMTSHFATQIGKGEMAVGARADHVLVTLPAALVQIRDHTDLTPSALVALCNVTTALSSGAFRTTVVSHAEIGARDPWDVPAARAATVARAVEQKCRYPSDRIATSIRSDPRAANADGSAIEIEIDTLEP